MPCYDPPMSEKENQYWENSHDRLTSKQLEACLCGVIRVAGNRRLQEVNWDEVGVSRELFYRWWDKHQKEDSDRTKT